MAGVLKLRLPLLLLLLLMPALLIPAGRLCEAKTCRHPSWSYKNEDCDEQPCTEHCRDEGYTDGECIFFSFPEISWRRCFCKRPC